MIEFFSTHAMSLLAQAQPAADGAPDVPFFQSGTFLFLLLVGAVTLGWFLAKTITNSLRLSEYSGRLAIVFVAILVAALMIWSKWPPKFGVDLRGGINMVGSLNMEAFAGTVPPAKTAASSVPAAYTANALVAIEAENTIDFGVELSPAVAGAIPEVVQAVLSELECLEPA